MIKEYFCIITMDISILIKKLDNDYYNAIKKTLATNNIEYEWLNNYMNNDTKTIDEEKNTETIEKSQVLSDESYIKKPWTKLNIIHKILKVKEYVNNLKSDNEMAKNKLKEELVNLIKMKLLKKENINYDEEKAIINNISKLEFKYGTFNYNNS